MCNSPLGSVCGFAGKQLSVAAAAAVAVVVVAAAVVAAVVAVPSVVSFVALPLSGSPAETW